MAEGNSASSKGSNREQRNGGQFEDYLKFVLRAADKLDLNTGHRRDGTSSSGERTVRSEDASGDLLACDTPAIKPQQRVIEDETSESNMLTAGADEASRTDRTFADFLQSCNTITKLRLEIAEKDLELHGRQLFHAAHHIVSNDALEGRIAMLQKLDSHLQSIVANKDYLIDQIHTSPLNTPAASLPVHVSHLESVLHTFSEMSSWIKNLEDNLSSAELDPRNSDVNDNLSAITSMTETLLANMNMDVKMIKELQNTVHEIYEMKTNN